MSGQARFQMQADPIVVSVPQDKTGDRVELKLYEHQLVTVRMADGSQGVASTRNNPWLALQAQKRFQAAIDKAGEPPDTDNDIEDIELDRDPVCACDDRECDCDWVLFGGPCEMCVAFYEARSKIRDCSGECVQK